MTHYERIGVSPGASAEEIHRAYLNRARSAHPDMNAPGAAHSEMAELNAAWATLGDPVARASYDRSIGVGGTGSAFGPGSSPPVERPVDKPFVPFDPDDDDDDSWRYEPDVGDPRTAVGRVATIVPVVLVLVGIVIGALGLVSGRAESLVLGALLFVAGAVGFVVVPLLAMGRAARYE